MRWFTQLLHFELGDTLELGLVAELTGCWTTGDPEVLQLTSGGMRHQARAALSCGQAAARVEDTTNH